MPKTKVPPYFGGGTAGVAVAAGAAPAVGAAAAGEAAGAVGAAGAAVQPLSTGRPVRLTTPAPPRKIWRRESRRPARLPRSNSDIFLPAVACGARRVAGSAVARRAP